MNEKEVFKKLRELDLPSDNFYILGDAALVLCGVKKETASLKLCVSSREFEKFVKSEKIDPKSKNKFGFYKLVDDLKVEVISKNKKEFKCLNIGDFMFEDIRDILELKKKTNFKKDKKDIEEIEKFLLKYPKYPKFN